ncbi:MAG: glycosyltransferase family 4 protein [Candidatus Omnitrophica bacterium]|nr:glycosyltransferase family 4 protein [Candidatus Omnitrophota bacterium]
MMIFDEKTIRVFRIFQNQRRGGFTYEKLLVDQLNSNSLKVIGVPVSNILPFSKGIRFQQLIRMVEYNRQESLLDIRSIIPTVSLLLARRKETKHIAVFHHHDSIGQSQPIFTEVFFRLFLISAKKYISKVVVVAEFWKEYLEKRGLTNICVIKNGFDVKDISSVSEEECVQFRRKYNLENKRIIYIGNNSRIKGVYIAYSQLKTAFPEHQLIASGEKFGKEPFLVLNMPYREYLVLLKVSECAVIYSLFNEGWCRTAHEAMLLKTPVVGSGKGGMRELLENGKQIICTNPKTLEKSVDMAINDKESLGEAGYKYAAQFDLNHFKESWMELITGLLD